MNHASQPTESLDGPEGATEVGAGRMYAAAWRWHFFAGIYVIPFLLMLAITGLVMVYFNSIETRLGKVIEVTGQGPRVTLVDQAHAAVQAVPGGKLKQYIAPASASGASIFIIEVGDKAHAVAIDPYTSNVLDQVEKDSTWFYIASKIHGTLLIGDFGDRLIEIAAGLGIFMVISGVYLWWPRGDTSLWQALRPRLRLKRRGWWKDLHAVIGIYTAAVLFLFLLSGLAWTGIWGSKLVQAWSTFPAQKWAQTPLSDATHASMNHGSEHQVPWGLEQTHLPLSGSEAGRHGIQAGAPVNLDTVTQWARSVGFDSVFRVDVPKDATGTYTVSADSMDGDTTRPTQDRTVHLDQYSGHVIGEVGYADYAPLAKAMAVGIALHQGDMGWWNTLLNTLFCLAVVFLCLSGGVMWWLRRPRQGAFKLAPPPLRRPARGWKVPIAVIVMLSVLFPLTGLAFTVMISLDLLLFSRVPVLKAILK